VDSLNDDNAPYGPTTNDHNDQEGNIIFLQPDATLGLERSVQTTIWSPTYQNARATCMFSFWYYVSGTTYGGDLIPVINGGEETTYLDFLRAEEGETTWKYSFIGIGRRELNFSVIPMEHK
jgi:hypothetical protein